MLKKFKRSANYLLVTGALAIIFGIVAIAWPASTALTLVLMWGIYALIDGISSLAQAFTSEDARNRPFLLVLGILGIVAGLVAIFRPLASAIILTVTIAIWLLARGILEVGSAFSEEASGARWPILFGGVLWILASIIMFANPGAAALGIAVWVGILALCWGMVLIVAGLRVRSTVKSAKT